MSDIPNKAFFRVDEVAEILCLSPRTIRRRVEDDTIPVVRVRNSVRISRSTLISLTKCDK